MFFGVVGNINSPVSNIALQWEKMRKMCYRWQFSHVTAGVEHNKLNSNNPIMSLKTQTRKPSLRNAIKPHSVQENILRKCT